VHAVAIDGASSDRSWLVLPRGPTTIRFDMGPVPSLTFGAAPPARPPSVSTHGLPAFGCEA
jgi:hypothetical protein